MVQQQRIARHELTGTVRIGPVARRGKSIRRAEGESLRSHRDKIVGDRLMPVIYGCRAVAAGDAAATIGVLQCAKQCCDCGAETKSVG